MYFLIYDLAVLSKGYGHFVYLTIVLASAYFLLSRQNVSSGKLKNHYNQSLLCL